MLCCVVLCCAVLCCAVLCCVVLCCVVLDELINLNWKLLNKLLQWFSRFVYSLKIIVNYCLNILWIMMKMLINQIV